MLSLPSHTHCVAVTALLPSVAEMLPERTHCVVFTASLPPSLKCCLKGRCLCLKLRWWRRR